MKKTLLFLGTILFLLISIPSQAQEEVKLTEKKMKQHTPIKKYTPIKVEPQKVEHGIIDPITGERIPPNTSTAPKWRDVSITYPESSDAYPFTSWDILTPEELVVRGMATSGSTLEIRLMKNSTVLQDWTSFFAKGNGTWETKINWGGTGNPQGLKLEIQVRDTAKKEDIATMQLGQRPFRGQASSSGGN